MAPKLSIEPGLKAVLAASGRPSLPQSDLEMEPVGLRREMVGTGPGVRSSWRGDEQCGDSPGT